MNPNEFKPDNKMGSEKKPTVNQIISPESQTQSPTEQLPTTSSFNTQPNQTQLTNQALNAANNKKNRVFVLIVVVFLVTFATIVAFTLINSSSEDSANESQSTQSNISTIEAAEAKADEFITINKNSSGANLTKEFLALASEMDKYAKYNELPNISSEERIKEAALIGGNIGLYSNIFESGIIEKTNVATVSSSDEQVVVYYRAENTSASFLKGPYEFSVYTSYIDGAWRIVDFRAQEL
jgi:hypothetical protein